MFKKINFRSDFTGNARKSVHSVLHYYVSPFGSGNALHQRVLAPEQLYAVRILMCETVYFVDAETGGG